MHPIEFEGQTHLIGANQPEYIPLPAQIDGNEIRTVWQLTPEEITAVSENGLIVMVTLSFGKPFQLVKFAVVGADYSDKSGQSVSDSDIPEQI